MITSQIKGKVLEAKVATFKDDGGKDVSYGKIQLLTSDMSGDFFQIQNVKVRTENFGWIPDISDSKGKDVSLNLENSSYNGKVAYYLATHLNAKSS